MLGIVGYSISQFLRSDSCMSYISHLEEDTLAMDNLRHPSQVR